MHRDLIAVPVALLGEAPEPREYERVHVFRAAHQPFLATEIVAKKEPVHQLARRREEPFVGFVVELANPVRGRLHDLWLGAHFHEILLHAEQIAEVVIIAGPKTTESVKISRRSQISKAGVEIQIVRVWPGELLDFIDRDAVCQRPDAAMFYSVQADVKQCATFRIAVNIRIQLWTNPPHIVPQFEAQFLLGFGAKVAMQNWPSVRMRVAQPEATMFYRLPGNQAFNEFARVHAFKPVAGVASSAQGKASELSKDALPFGTTSRNCFNCIILWLC